MTVDHKITTTIATGARQNTVPEDGDESAGEGVWDWDLTRDLSVVTLDYRAKIEPCAASWTTIRLRIRKGVEALERLVQDAWALGREIVYRAQMIRRLRRGMRRGDVSCPSP